MATMPSGPSSVTTMVPRALDSASSCPFWTTWSVDMLLCLIVQKLTLPDLFSLAIRIETIPW